MALLVATYLAPSTVCSGTGLFAGEELPAGAAVCDYDPHTCVVYDEAVWQRMAREVDTHSFDFIAMHTVKALDGRYYLPLDGLAFLNHAEEPNLVFRSDNAYFGFAARDIRRGEELLGDYRRYYDPAFFEHVMRLR